MEYFEFWIVLVIAVFKYGLLVSKHKRLTATLEKIPNVNRIL